MTTSRIYFRQDRHLWDKTGDFPSKDRQIDDHANLWTRLARPIRLHQLLRLVRGTPENFRLFLQSASSHWYYEFMPR
jgi:hypothetical protein